MTTGDVPARRLVTLIVRRRVCLRFRSLRPSRDSLNSSFRRVPGATTTCSRPTVSRRFDRAAVVVTNAVATRSVEHPVLPAGQATLSPGSIVIPAGVVLTTARAAVKTGGSVAIGGGGGGAGPGGAGPPPPPGSPPPPPPPP